MSENQTLTTKQRKALEALLLTGEPTAAATAAGVHRDTIYRWLKQPVFRDASGRPRHRRLTRWHGC